MEKYGTINYNHKQRVSQASDASPADNSEKQSLQEHQITPHHRKLNYHKAQYGKNKGRDIVVNTRLPQHQTGTSPLNVMRIYCSNFQLQKRSESFSNDNNCKTGPSFKN